MTAVALSKHQSEMLNNILKTLLDDCEAVAVAVCEISGSILAQELRNPDKPVGNAAALAAATFAAARALAESIGEPGFKSIFHKGKKSGVMIQSLGGEFLILVVLGDKSIEGMVRLCLKKVVKQLASILTSTSGQTLEEAGVADDFEVEEDPDIAKPS